MQLSFEYLQEQRFLRPSGHPVPVFDCPHCEKKLFLYIQGNLEATFVCFILSFCWALLWRVWLLWRKVTLCCCYTLPSDSWRQQSDTHTYILLLNAGQTLLSQLHLLHHMLQPLNYPHILAVVCWNLSSLLISSFYWKYCFASTSLYNVVGCLGYPDWFQEYSAKTPGLLEGTGPGPAELFHLNRLPHCL